MDGYLSILPEAERRGVLSHIKEQSAQVFADITYDEYKLLVDQIADERALATTVDPQVNLIDSAKHNKFFGSTYTDLCLMFNEVELIRRSIDSYEKLANSELAELAAEIDLLRANIIETENAVDEKDSVISFSSAFEYSDYNEIPNKANTYLFQDRDGTALHNVAISNNKIVLAKGNIQTGAEQLASYKVTLNKDASNGYDMVGKELSKMIDSDENSSWIHIIPSEKPITSYVQQEDKLVTMPNLATCELKVNFNSATSLNYIEFLFDGKYPPHVIYIKYDNNKYIFTNKLFTSTVQTAIQQNPKRMFSYTMFFPEITTTALYIMLGQSDYDQTVEIDDDGGDDKTGPTGQAPETKKEYITYTVKKGDCLYHIGKKFGVTWQSLAKLNNVPGPKYYIYAGQVLKIREKQNYITHIAKKGDTLSKLGKQYKIDWRSIAKLNGLSSPYTIYIGREYLIKKK